MELQKMIDEMNAKEDKAARDLPLEIKRMFWKSFYEDGKSIGEARANAGITDVGVAVALIIQCYKTKYIPLEVDEIE